MLAHVLPPGLGHGEALALRDANLARSHERLRLLVLQLRGVDRGTRSTVSLTEQVEPPRSPQRVLPLDMVEPLLNCLNRAGAGARSSGTRSRCS
jgi:hypothetical protein